MSKECSMFSRMVLVCLMTLGFAFPAMAQDAPTLDVSAGYNLLKFEEDAFGDESTFPAGWYADVAANLTPMFAVVGQVTGNYKSLENEVGIGDTDVSIHTFMGGVRATARATPSVAPFAQVLFGGARAGFSTEVAGVEISDSSTDGALQLGGGVNFMGGGNVGLRVGLDYIRVFSEDEGTNVLRFAAGVVFGFGN